MPENRVSSVKGQYELWPYPEVPLIAKIHRDSLWQINLEWMFRRLGQEVSPNPRIWIAGCGTFQPYTFARANPGASILATDLSEHSLKIAKRRCRFHGLKNIEFRSIDLSNSQTYPDEKFDLIECYGVLMSLPNPLATLKEFAKRLKPNGILRLMVYTHYGRQRIFQIQKLAQLLGLGAKDKSHPRVLRRLMSALPESHPLKSTFFDYPDAKNLPGIVDGFLHASDRGFTGQEISKLLDDGGFQWGFCYHRPWGDPNEMAKKLGISGRDPAYWLHYLDLWQSLKSNFILSVVHKKHPQNPGDQASFKHPLFDLRERTEIRHKLRLLKQGILGTKLQSRTHEKAIRLTAKEVRSLIRGQGNTPLVGEILGQERVKPQPFFESKPGFPLPSDPWLVELGKSPNPLYGHLFDAFLFSNDLEAESKKWQPYSRPLEGDEHPWGLTPASTYENQKQAIQEWLGTKDKSTKIPISEVRLPGEEVKFGNLRDFLGRFRDDILIPADSDSLRMLWILLFSHDQLFLEFEAP